MGKDGIQVTYNYSFFLKMQVTDETRAKNRRKKIDLPFSCAVLSEGEKKKKRKPIEKKPMFQGNIAVDKR